MTNSEPQIYLLYDGICGFCNWSVRLILKYDRKKTMMFSPLQSEFARNIIKRHQELHGIDSIVYLEIDPEKNARAFLRSTAVFRCVNYLGGWWKVLMVFTIIPRPVRDWMYDTFAQYRYTIFGRYDSCVIPHAAVRSRFIE